MSEHDVPLGDVPGHVSGNPHRRVYPDADTYQADAIRTRSTIYTPELLSLNWLEQTLANAAQLGRDARRLKKAAFGGVADPDRPGGSSHSMNFDPRRVSPQVLHSMLGIINEAGEMAEMIHRVLSGQQSFDSVNWKEEKGDAAWFLFCDCDETGVAASDILASNIAKLKARYPGKFDSSKLDDAGRDKNAEMTALTAPAKFPLDGVCGCCGVPSNTPLCEHDRECHYFDDPAEHAS